MAESERSNLTPEQCAAARRVQRLPQKALAAAIGKSQVFVSLFERGKAQLNPREAKVFCRILGIGR